MRGLYGHSHVSMHISLTALYIEWPQARAGKFPAQYTGSGRRKSTRKSVYGDAKRLHGRISKTTEDEHADDAKVIASQCLRLRTIAGARGSIRTRLAHARARKDEQLIQTLVRVGRTLARRHQRLKRRAPDSVRRLLERKVGINKVRSVLRLKKFDWQGGLKGDASRPAAEGLKRSRRVRCGHIS